MSYSKVRYTLVVILLKLFDLGAMKVEELRT